MGFSGGEQSFGLLCRTSPEAPSSASCAKIKSGPSMALRRAYGPRRAPPCTRVTLLRVGRDS